VVGGKHLVAIGVAAACVAGAGVARVVSHDALATAMPVAGFALPAPPAAPPPAEPGPPSAAPRPARPAARLPYAIPARPAYPQPCPVPVRPGRSPYVRTTPKSYVPDSALPAPLAPAPRTPDLAAVRGKGWWIYQMRNTERGSVPAIVARAKRAGHAAGLTVVAWDFPYLHDPVADAARAEQALAFVAPGGHRIDGFAPDIETAGEGTIATARRAQVYLSRVRAAAGDRPVVATIPRVTGTRLATFPYAAMAPYVDVYAPMVYWSCNEPGQLAAENLRALSTYRPVHLIGQSYDMGAEGGRRGDPRGAELWRFLDVGRTHGAVGVSFYAWHTATAEQFAAVAAFPWESR
jgi:hypothetical protein